MELYLDSADINEIEEAFGKLGFLAGLTTTPTFMHRHGITDVDGMILKLAKIVPVLQIEALGETADEIYKEAHRLDKLGLDKEKTVYKIPVSLEGVRACKMLTNEGFKVNVHLVYTLQQAYMAMAAGATYVCPLVGRLQDQGHDALALVEQCVDAVEIYGYDTKIMFSSVRHAEHVRNAINMGVHTCTVPWKVMKALTENNFTELGTQQFFEHTKLMTVKVKDIISTENPIVLPETTVLDAILGMTESGFGAVTVVDENGSLKGIFTDGDLRRNIKENGKAILQKTMAEFQFKMPVTIDQDALLNEAVKIFKDKKIDNIIVTANGKPCGMIDVQDLIKLNLWG
ncbi:MAG: transaldolase [Bacteroidetes bacterium GWF2_38_335]|nr:MAG: transaldolase [Bacteroidetes bacterium GWF2_38_335]OFY79709.1 MAG: transaldolase [Bacteroidetes bacterium RIFOXYA12_FULL_38_20]HBS87586.1 transaldolase [Bacteroidales bacterium]